MIILQYALSLVLWFWFWSCASVSVTVALILSFFVPRPGLERFIQGICTFLCYSVFLIPRVHREKKEQVYPVIYVANHVSFFDLFLSSTVLDGYPRGFELASHFKTPVYGWFIGRFGQIPIDPSSRQAILKSFDRASAILKNKERNIFIMPEGTRTRDGKIGKFKYGAFMLAIRSGQPIVPVVYKKLYNHSNAHNILIKPGYVDVYIGDPIYPDSFKNEREYGEYVRDVMIKMEEDN